jgi:ferredoxin
LEVVRALAGEESATQDISWKGAPFAAVEVNSDCAGCNVCETLCPVGALSRRQEAEAVPEATRTVDPARREEGGIFALEFDPALCTGCGVCEVACFPKAIRVRETWVPSALLERRTHALIRARRQTCAACGGAFLGNEAGLCPFCLKPKIRQETIARRWASAENSHDRG